MKKLLFVLLALVAGFSYDADAQFLKKLSKGLEKVSKEAEKVQKLLDPNAQQQDKKETESKQPAQQSNDAGSAKIQDVVWNGTSFSIPRITPDTRYLRLPDSACRIMRRCRMCMTVCSPCIMKAMGSMLSSSKTATCFSTIYGRGLDATKIRASTAGPAS